MQRLKIALITTSVILVQACSTPDSDGAYTRSNVANCRTDAIEQAVFSTDTNRILVVAHRGAHDIVPENSIPAIERAAALGAIAVELDVRRTSDGRYVLMHDETLDRTTSGMGRVDETDFDTFRSLRLRTTDGHLTDQPAPTFSEALDAAKDRIWVMIDSKVDEPEDIRAIADIVAEKRMGAQIITYDYLPELLQEYAEAIPESHVMARTKDPKEVDAMIARMDPDIFHIEPSYSDLALARKFDALGMPTWLNLIGDTDAQAELEGEQVYEPLLSTRPDIVHTDRPAELIAYLRETGRHPSQLSEPERALCR